MNDVLNPIDQHRRRYAGDVQQSFEPEHIGAAWDAALKADRPSVLEFVTDPEVPPLPPHISFEQAKKFMKSLLHDPGAVHDVFHAFNEWMLDDWTFNYSDRIYAAPL